MSLINQMLQDLDARGQNNGPTAIHAQVRAVGSRQVSSRVIAAVLVAVVVAGAAGAWFWMRMKSTPTPMPQVLPVTPAPQVNAPQPNTPAAAPVVAAAATPAPVTAAPSPMAPSGPGGLRMSSDLSMAKPARAGTPVVAATPKAELPKLDPPKLAPAKSSPAKNELASAETASSAKPAKPNLAPAMRPGIVPDREAKMAAPPADLPRVPNPAVGFKQPDAAEKSARARPSSEDSPASGKNVKEVSEQQRAENEYRAAVTLIQQGKSAEAMRGLEQALYLDQLHAAARLTLVSLLVDAKQPATAIRRLKEGLALDPAQAGMAMALARLQVEKGEGKQAIEVLQKTLPYTADRADYQAFLAALLQRAGRNKEAVEHYLNALRLTPQSGVWWMGLGISLQADNRNAEAIDSFVRAKNTNNLTPQLTAFVDQKLAQLRR